MIPSISRLWPLINIFLGFLNLFFYLNNLESIFSFLVFGLTILFLRKTPHFLLFSNLIFLSSIHHKLYLRYYEPPVLTIRFLKLKFLFENSYCLWNSLRVVRFHVPKSSIFLSIILAIIIILISPKVIICDILLEYLLLPSFYLWRFKSLILPSGLLTLIVNWIFIEINFL